MQLLLACLYASLSDILSAIHVISLVTRCSTHVVHILCNIFIGFLDFLQVSCVLVGRDATSSRVGEVRLQAMQAFTSALVHGGLERRKLLLSRQHIGDLF